MKGLELSYLYFKEVFLPACHKHIPWIEGHFAAGLVGEGSECFGYDDELSKDHSFGLRLCLWLTPEDFAEYGREFHKFWDELPEDFMGYKRPVENKNEGKRNGIFMVDEFYNHLLGVADAPENPIQWLAIEEPYLAAATNGKVYCDQPGRFTAVRNRLLSYYPDDVIKYYLAKYSAIAAQTGQYNMVRAYLHGEELAVNIIKNRFIYSAIALVFLLNKTYRPFYKWAPKAMRRLPVLGEELYDKLLLLSVESDINKLVFLTEEICSCLLGEMRKQGYTSGQSNYLMDHLPEIMNQIETKEIKLREISMVF